MGKYAFKPGNMIYPVPAVLVSAADREGNTNIFTAAWTGTICTNPPMAYISVRPERYSYHMIRETGEFVINLTTKELARAADYCGVRSGRDVDKWKEMKLTPVKGREVSVPLIGESPVNIECRVTEVKELGSHHMFLAQVVAVSVDEAYMDENGRFDLNASGLIAYSHGQYRELGENLGGFGFSVQKNAKRAESRRQKETDRKTTGETAMKKNVTLIGMPSSGKSTVGVLLAKKLGYSFVDGDIIIQEKEKKLLKELIAEHGIEGFWKIEEKYNAELDVEHSVIAPGGSVIYGPKAMEHLKEISVIVYLKMSCEEVEKRIGDPVNRGVTLKEGWTLRDLYNERVPYYEKYADITVDEENLTLGETLDEICRKLSGRLA